ncbi:MAG: DNA mismatch repair protein MutS [Hyphomicrobiales bacterium]
MEQYIEIKTANPDSLLFYRMGDFYELFFDDAEIASRALGITLTRRGKHLGEDIPMCGVPVHAADEYLQRLIALGHRVAVCEQTEDPAEARKRGAKSVVRRDVIRLVTPGTLTEDTLLDAGRHNYLAALDRQKAGEDGDDQFAIAWIDISTGDFRVVETAFDRLSGDLARIDAREIVVPDSLFGDPALKSLLAGAPAALAPVPRAFFDRATAAERLAAYFGVASLDAFGDFSRLELSAAAGALAYVERTQLGARPPLGRPLRETAGSVMLIDAATRANLELTRTFAGERRGSLLSAIDRTVTGPGQRLLAERLSSPLTDPQRIDRRLDAVAFLLEEAAFRDEVRDLLKRAPDIARALSRLTLERGGPRDLGAIRAGCTLALELAGLLRRHAGLGLPEELATIATDLAALPPDIGDGLATALRDELPVLKRDGGFVREGFSGDLDDARELRDESRRVIAGLQAAYAEETEVRALKVRHNNVLGYFVEVSANHAERFLSAPLNARFIHRQTMAGAVRFSTTELGELEARIANAGDRALAIELAVFAELAAMVVAAGEPLKRTAAALAALDVAAALAARADEGGYCRPVIDGSLAFAIDGGRHPVVEEALKAGTGEPFVANDCDLGAGEGAAAGRIWLLTGPNMAGKSTFLRQNALIAVIAQAGGFVPARSARIGIVDRLFSRVGASDDLARGRSTFMVEMIETAAILNQAGPRALVILDEIGRGTATFDGLSIAWAAIEHLHEVNRARALFATHYHELTALSERLDRLFNATVKVKEWNGDVVFLHEIAPGAADRSYGIQVARLAGLPAAVISRAREVLEQLETSDRKSPAELLVDDLPLFSASPPPPAPRRDEALERLLADLDTLAPDDMSPREALEALYALKAARASQRAMTKK